MNCQLLPGRKLSLIMHMNHYQYFSVRHYVDISLRHNFFNTYNLKQDWKQKAQSYREDVDTGLLNKMQCPTCRKSFTRDKDCKQHIKGCKTCVCAVCNKTFDHESKLKRHTNKMHLSTYKCETCNKVFAERRNLARHQRTHK